MKKDAVALPAALRPTLNGSAAMVPMSSAQGELRGTICLEGRPLSGLAPHDAAQYVGLVFQNPNLQLINMTVQSELAFGPENLARPVRRAEQRTAIAATLAMRPRVLVLDEPLSDLDPVGAQEVLGTLRRLARSRYRGRGDRAPTWRPTPRSSRSRRAWPGRCTTSGRPTRSRWCRTRTLRRC